MNFSSLFSIDETVKLKNYTNKLKSPFINFADLKVF